MLLNLQYEGVHNLRRWWTSEPGVVFVTQAEYGARLIRKPAGTRYAREWGVVRDGTPPKGGHSPPEGFMLTGRSSVIVSLPKSCGIFEISYCIKMNVRIKIIVQEMYSL